MQELNNFTEKVSSDIPKKSHKHVPQPRET